MPTKKYHVYLSDEERKYLERFVEERLEALKEKPSLGKKPKLTGRDEAMLMAIAFDPRGWRLWLLLREI
ncbi:MAG: helix-turn-helix domain-containing protein [Candidatus Methanospirareceae archaeon]